MKRMKRLVCLMLAVLSAFAFCACGDAYAAYPKLEDFKFERDGSQMKITLANPQDGIEYTKLNRITFKQKENFPKEDFSKLLLKHNYEDGSLEKCEKKAGNVVMDLATNSGISMKDGGTVTVDLRVWYTEGDEPAIKDYYQYFEETPSTIEFLFNYKNKQGLVVKYENGKYYKQGNTQDEWIELA